MFADIHRFGDCVAISVGDGGTTYLTPEQAVQLRDALSKCIKDIKSNKFLFSTFPVTHIEIDSGKNISSYVYRRRKKVLINNKVRYVPA